jgi:hypothetical protein
MLEELRRLDTDRIDLEQAVALSCFGRQVQAEFTTLNIEEPEWIGTRLRELRREIRTRQQDAIDKRLREAKLRLSSLASPDEKRAKLQAEIEKLEAMVSASP